MGPRKRKKHPNRRAGPQNPAVKAGKGTGWATRPAVPPPGWSAPMRAAYLACDRVVRAQDAYGWRTENGVEVEYGLEELRDAWDAARKLDGVDWDKVHAVYYGYDGIDTSYPADYTPYAGAPDDAAVFLPGPLPFPTTDAEGDRWAQHAAEVFAEAIANDRIPLALKDRPGVLLTRAQIATWFTHRWETDGDAPDGDEDPGEHACGVLNEMHGGGVYLLREDGFFEYQRDPADGQGLPDASLFAAVTAENRPAGAVAVEPGRGSG